MTPGCRPVSFAGNTLTLEYDDQRAQEMIDFLFVSTPTAEILASFLTLQLGIHTQTGKWMLIQEGSSPLERDSEGEMAEMLLDKVTFHLLNESHGGVVLHAGVLAWKGKGILIPGVKGAGKTTLVAWLTNKGLDYLTDEMVWVPVGTEQLHAFTRPLNLKKPSRRVVGQYLDFDRNNSRILSNSRLDLIAAKAIRPDNQWSIPSLRMFLFPRYDPLARPRIEPLSKAQTAMALSVCLLNIDNLEGLAFPEIVRLARSAPAYRLHYNRLEDMEDQIETLLG